MTKLIRYPTVFPTSIFRDFDSIFERAFEGHGDLFDRHTNTVKLNQGFPKGAVWVDEDQKLHLELVTAGYKKDQLSVRVEDSDLIVEGKKDESGTPSRILTKGSFQKRLKNYGDQFDLHSSSVSYEDGVLHVVVPPVEPKEEESQVVELEIK